MIYQRKALPYFVMEMPYLLWSDFVFVEFQKYFSVTLDKTKSYDIINI